MKKFLLPQNGNFYKTNLHCHSTCSDGRLTVEELKDLYKSMGYSAVAFTDHDIFFTHNDLTDEGFVALNGFEAAAFDTFRCCHLCFIATDPDSFRHPSWYLHKNICEKLGIKHDISDPSALENKREYTPEFVNYMIRKGKEDGFFVSYNHPVWSKENYPIYSKYKGFDAIEMFNGGSLVAGYDDYNPHEYDDMLYDGKKVFCLGSDDNHNIQPRISRRFDSGIAFTMLKAEKLDYKSLISALKNGDFYASTGPEIFELYYEDKKVYVKFSDADKVTCTFGSRMAGVSYAEGDTPLNSAVFAVPDDCVWFRFTVTDVKGNHACTNAYFMEDILGE